MIDTHCHIHDQKAFSDPAATLERARQAGIDRVIVVGVNPEDWTRAIEFADRFESAFAIVGWHPNYTADYDPASLPHLEELLAHPKVKALGEIGLDYHWDYAAHSVQRQALIDQLDLAVRREKPVVFHAREAYSDLLDILEQRPPHPYLFHCWAGNAEEAARATKLDAYFGVDGPITYKKADELRTVFAGLRHDRLVTETDSPYMAPVPHRGKPNEPAHVSLINAALAGCLGVSEAECARVTTENGERFFRL